ncbi:MAG: zinc dependent phospholipase C family protein [Atopobiaceae bacterium]|nr:zinc dependent phospholipase C family protein [Atopobiaceae bacterium]MCH4181114.1 zinc dependent phospholipase C family protein [Atopobiaceae bacterium]MCH4214087.1 zinc dependent phospholipase C family protein [Atopobiaceae bacterium]MCH4229550.1 zinc dependent phospholipase C family protein [Atopobiaceae bacterium]MCH4276439.1 zinc dependent phospholipase C family protein [Atopobiaceae bacterium]
MPAVYAHHFFAEHAIALLPPRTLASLDESYAFTLGNQGPDPLFFRWRGSRADARVAHSLARACHRTLPTTELETARAAEDDADEAEPGAGPVARAFALGLLAHYVLDSTTHPFVYAQEASLIDAADGLEDAQSETHAVIEAELDSMMLWRERGKTVADYPDGLLPEVPTRVLEVADLVMGMVAGDVYGVTLPDDVYRSSLEDMRWCYRHIEPAGSLKARAVGTCERAFRSHSQAQAMAHPVMRQDTCPSDNPDHLPWRDPFTGRTSKASFTDLFDEALRRWGDAAELSVAGEPLVRVTHHRNHNGRALAPEEDRPLADLSGTARTSLRHEVR